MSLVPNNPRPDREGNGFVSETTHPWGPRLAALAVLLAGLVFAAWILGLGFPVRSPDEANPSARSATGQSPEQAADLPRRPAVIRPARPTAPSEEEPSPVATPRPESAPGTRAAGTPASQRAASAPAPEDGETGEVPSGLGLFPAPGTNPPKSGMVVPDDFELPPGYMRHHQFTDDGKPLPAILMFHPDAEVFDREGNPIPRPEDGVVPPELVPDGMPLERLEVPEVAVPMVEPPPEGANEWVDEENERPE